MDTSDAFLAIIAAAAAIITAVGAAYAGWQAAIAQDALEHTKRIAADQVQPYVFADIRSDEQQAQLVVAMVKNQGPTVATQIRVRFDPPVVPTLDGSGPLTAWDVSALTPGAEYLIALGPGSKFFVANRGRRKIVVDAEGCNGRVPTLTYDVDLDVLARTLAARKSTADVVSALEKISGSVGRVSSSVDQFGRAVLDVAQRQVIEGQDLRAIAGPLDGHERS